MTACQDTCGSWCFWYDLLKSRELIAVGSPRHTPLLIRNWLWDIQVSLPNLGIFLPQNACSNWKKIHIQTGLSFQNDKPRFTFKNDYSNRHMTGNSYCCICWSPLLYSFMRLSLWWTIGANANLQMSTYMYKQDCTKRRNTKRRCSYPKAKKKMMA